VFSLGGITTLAGIWQTIVRELFCILPIETPATNSDRALILKSGFIRFAFESKHGEATD